MRGRRATLTLPAVALAIGIALPAMQSSNLEVITDPNAGGPPILLARQPGLDHGVTYGIGRPPDRYLAVYGAVGVAMIGFSRTPEGQQGMQVGGVIQPEGITDAKARWAHAPTLFGAAVADPPTLGQMPRNANCFAFRGDDLSRVIFDCKGDRWRDASRLTIYEVMPVMDKYNEHGFYNESELIRELVARVEALEVALEAALNEQHPRPRRR